MADFATYEDVGIALRRPLTTPEQAAASDLIAEASALLRILVPTLVDRLADSPDLTVLAKAKVVNAVVRVMRNPTGAKQLQEAAGPFSHSMSGMAGGGISGIFFTDDELMPLRESVAAIGTSYVGVRRSWGDESDLRRRSRTDWPGGAGGEPYYGYGPGWWGV